MAQEIVPAPTAADYARLSLSPATLRAYRADWADFTAWCQGRGVSALPADPNTVADYLASLALTHGRSALKRRLSAIGQAHRLKEVAWRAATWSAFDNWKRKPRRPGQSTRTTFCSTNG